MDVLSETKFQLDPKFLKIEPDPLKKKDDIKNFNTESIDLNLIVILEGIIEFFF